VNLSEILSLCNYVANKEKLGNTLTPEQYNILLEAVNVDFFRKEYEEAQKISLAQNVNIGSVIFKSGALKVFRYKDDGVIATTGVITVSDLTKTYTYWVSMTTTYNGAKQGIELISDAELEDRLINLLNKPIEYFPVAIDNGDEILIYPTDVTPVDFTYLRMPVQPVYAWVQDAYDRARYLTPYFYTKTATIGAAPDADDVHQITVNYNTEGAVTICDYKAIAADGLTKQVLAQKMAESVNDLYSSTGYFASVGTEEFTIYLSSSTLPTDAEKAKYVIAGVDGSDNFTIATPIDIGTGGSTELEFTEIYHPQIVQELLSRIGVSLKAEQVQAYAERAKAENKIV